MIKIVAAVMIAISLTSTVYAVGLRHVIRDCGPDGKIHCKGVGYGAPMQACLSKKKSKLTPACRASVERLEKGEKVQLFG